MQYICAEIAGTEVRPLCLWAHPPRPLPPRTPNKMLLEVVVGHVIDAAVRWREEEDRWKAG